MRGIVRVGAAFGCFGWRGLSLAALVILARSRGPIEAATALPGRVEFEEGYSPARRCGAELKIKPQKGVVIVSIGQRTNLVKERK